MLCVMGRRERIEKQQQQEKENVYRLFIPLNAYQCQKMGTCYKEAVMGLCESINGSNSLLDVFRQGRDGEV